MEHAWAFTPNPAFTLQMSGLTPPTPCRRRPLVLCTSHSRSGWLLSAGARLRAPGQAAACMSRPPASAPTAMAVGNDVAPAAPAAGSALAQDNNTAADYYNLSYSPCARPCDSAWCCVPLHTPSCCLRLLRTSDVRRTAPWDTGTLAVLSWCMFMFGAHASCVVCEACVVCTCSGAPLGAQHASAC